MDVMIDGKPFEVIQFDGGVLPVINGKLVVDENGKPLPELKIAWSYHITIDAVFSEQHGKRWCARTPDKCVLSRSEREFIYEPMPSSRDDEFLDDTRWESVEELVNLVEEWKTEQIQKALKGSR